jgi:DNA polymerase III epsilon subunit-like protein
MVANAPVISEIIPDFLNFIKDDIIVAHNSSFDM